MKTIIAAFGDATSAQAAAEYLRSRGINCMQYDYDAGGASLIDVLKTHKVSQRKAQAYAEMTRRGAIVLIADAPDGDAEQLADGLDRMGSLDIDASEKRWRDSGWTGYDARAQGYDGSARASEYTAWQRESNLDEATGKALDVVEEKVRVGKREVPRGAVRVRTVVTERPVREDVQLREERIDVTRERVDEPISPDTVDTTLSEDEFVVTATGEEAVVGKEARVVERVHVGKKADVRTEHIEETERRKDVEVEEVDETTTGRSRPPAR